MAKISWGTGIVIGVTLFMAAILVVVAFSFTQKVDLVTDNYYEKEIKYQDEINKQKNAAGLSAPLGFAYANPALAIAFPSELAGKQVDGTLHLYRPSDSAKDKLYKVSQVVPGSLTLDVGTLIAGPWKIKFDFSSGGRGFSVQHVLLVD